MNEQQEMKETTLIGGGLNEMESNVMSRLVAAWNGCLVLPMTSDELTVMRQAINTIQQSIAYRVVRRAYPEYWR
ncbi:hypothetical protein OEZ77_26340 [Leclercia adecarboxylata]|uniref:hypothetical protein n=1 Tax=Leclercia adecarboxylata TaxID=83655 RepID=UPI00234CC9E5|nr:hypothetical protein [Leclercia adecarboxylata]MDC6690052.1 hypothetical protein [Leclercia adecarboxylata]